MVLYLQTRTDFFSFKTNRNFVCVITERGLHFLQNYGFMFEIHTYYLKVKSFLLETFSSEADAHRNKRVVGDYLERPPALTTLCLWRRQKSRDTHRVDTRQQHLGHVRIDLLQRQLLAEEEAGEQPAPHSLPSVHVAPDVPQLVVNVDLACVKTVFLLKEVPVENSLLVLPINFICGGSEANLPSTSEPRPHACLCA